MWAFTRKMDLTKDTIEFYYKKLGSSVFGALPKDQKSEYLSFCCFNLDHSF